MSMFGNMCNELSYLGENDQISIFNFYRYINMILFPYICDGVLNFMQVLNLYILRNKYYIKSS